MKHSVKDLQPAPSYDITRQEAFKLLSTEFNNSNLVTKGLTVLKDKEIINPKVSLKFKFQFFRISKEYSK